MTGALFLTFLRLGLTSVGGPIAHLAYFREEFVHRRAWFTDAQFTSLLALCQALPGPASSQLGFAVGLLRGGLAGGLAAFVGFTLPSAVLMLGLAMVAATGAGALPAGLLAGLKLVAVVVVAHGLVGMARTLWVGLPRLGIGALALAAAWALPAAWGQVAIIAAGALLGAGLCRDARPLPAAGGSAPFGPRVAACLLVVCAAGLLLALAWPVAAGPRIASLAAGFYQAAALVFGGGHVVLPLLEASVVEPGWVGRDAFLAGYGAAQAVPGPMFSLAAYLGALVPTGQAPALGALVALLALFLPGLLLVAGILPSWHRLASLPAAPAVLAGVNAAVVGLLAAAFAGLVLPAGVAGGADAVLAAAALVLLSSTRWNLVAVAALVVAARAILHGWA